MAPQAATTSGSSEKALAKVRTQILEAVKELFERAAAKPDAPEITDNKTDLETPLPSSGPLQDCEFGMILLRARGWLKDEFLTSTNIDSPTFERVVIALVRRTAKRLIEKEMDDEGGGGQRAVFFTGKPYSKHGSKKYSANLDAAMIALAFLAPALEAYNDQLVTLSHDVPGDVRLPEWVTNLRDAALYIIIEGLAYASECRVTTAVGEFNGFSCDPDSNAASTKGDGSLENRFDRLFFTWTACETIRELAQWRDAYLRTLTAPGPPPEIVRDLASRIDSLEAALGEAARWCEPWLRQDFEDFSVDDSNISKLVGQIEPLGRRAPTEDQAKRIIEMARCVQYVYHMSQYAAVRSLGPEKTISLHEVSVIAKKLNQLVFEGIVSTKLDASKQESLYSSLTRTYSLGKWGLYADDAWYPLVVRSLSGLLSRTLDDIGKRSTRPEVLDLVNSYEGTLQIHVNAMTNRRPEGGSNGPDGKLWSFADGSPYVLYATQRTIFALIEYARFVTEVEHFRNSEPDVDKREDDLSMLLARKFADDLRPVVRKWIAGLPVPTATVPRQDSRDPDIELPRIPWAASLLRSWVGKFAVRFNDECIEDQITQRANTLELIRNVDKLSTDGQSPSRARALQSCKKLVQEIQELGPPGQALAELATWTNESTRGILLAYLLRDFIDRQPKSLMELFENEEPASLWKLIERARSAQDSFKNAK